MEHVQLMSNTWYGRVMTSPDATSSKPVALPRVDEDDLVELAADLGAGIFPAADIYNWYVSIAEDSGRRPVGKKAFGVFLKESGWQPSINYLNGKMTRCWMINKPWARRGAQMLADELAASKVAASGD